MFLISKSKTLSVTKKPKQRRAGKVRPSTKVADYQALEDRQMMAFAAAFDGMTLVIDQISDDGIVTIDNNGADGRFRVSESTGTTTFDDLPGNFIVNLLDSNSLVNVQLDNAYDGDLTLNAGNGARILRFSGASNTVGGDLEINAGDGKQLLNLNASARPLLVSGNLKIDLGAGNDEVADVDQTLEVGGDLALYNANQFSVSSQATVGGDIVFDVSGESVDSEFVVPGMLVANGNVDVIGGTGGERVKLDAAPAKSIAGNLRVDFNENESGGAQSVELGSSIEVGGNLKVLSAGESEEFVSTQTGTFVGGNTHIDLAEGLNTVDLRHQTDGSSLRIFGGDDNNSVLIETTGSAVDVFANFGTGDDDFQLAATTPINELVRIDFGSGDDTFTNHAGSYTSNVTLFSLNGFTSFYTFDDDTLSIKQQTNFGDVLLDTNGLVDAIRVSGDSGSTFQEHTPATNLRYFAKADQQSNVTIDLDSALPGDLSLKLRRGERTLNFTGVANEIMGDLRIGASVGKQTVNLAETADLRVSGNVVVNLRGEMDTVNNNGQKLQVDGNLFIRNVNEFEVTNTLGVGGDLVYSTLTDNTDSSFVNNSQLNVTGDLLYFGGDLADELSLIGSNMISGSIYAHLGSNESAFNVQSLLASDNTFIDGHVNVLSGPTDSSVILNLQATNIGGNVFVNFEETGGNNLVTISCRAIGGTAGGFRGGSGNDRVMLGGSAADMVFSALFHEGDDELEIDTETNLLSAFLDFGEGDDILVNHANLDLAVVNL